MTTQIGMVEAGLVVAAVPSLAMPAADHPLLVSVPLIDPIVTRKVGLIRRKGRTLSPAAQQLYEFFEGWGEGYSPPPRQHPVHHHARLAEVGRRVAHRGELLARHVLRDLGVFGQ